jgi:hypothetical protein
MAKDNILDAVKNALIKDGWTITADPFRIEYEEFVLLADLAAERAFAVQKEARRIIIEIKSFAGRSFVKELQQALGQYSMYFDFIDLNGLNYELYLAVSQAAYNDFFLQKAAQVVVQRHQLNILIVNVDQEEIVEWKNSPITNR